MTNSETAKDHQKIRIVRTLTVVYETTVSEYPDMDLDQALAYERELPHGEQCVSIIEQVRANYGERASVSAIIELVSPE